MSSEEIDSLEGIRNEKARAGRRLSLFTSFSFISWVVGKNCTIKRGLQVEIFVKSNCSARTKTQRDSLPREISLRWNIVRRQNHRTLCLRKRIRSVSQLSCSSSKVAQWLKFRPLWTRVKLSHWVTLDISPLGSPPINTPHPPTICGWLLHWIFSDTSIVSYPSPLWVEQFI